MTAAPSFTPHYVLASGGTGGHIYPAIATAHELQRRGARVTLLGARGGMEEGIAAQAGVPFVGVSSGKLDRSSLRGLDPRQALGALRGVLEARRWLARARPQGVVGYGGYASLPGVLAAQSLRLPTALHEQNARLGLTQRLAAGRAQVVGTAFEVVQGLEPGRGVYVGMPVREERLPPAQARAELGLAPDRLTLMIMGGSQGSLAMNRALPGALRALLGPDGVLDGQAIQVIHSTGPRWLAEVAPTVEGLPWYHPVGYLNAVAGWSAADLAITRAGTGTIAEGAYHGVPLLLVPLPSSAEDHQRANARAVQAAGAGLLLEQSRLEAGLGEAGPNKAGLSKAGLESGLGAAVLECLHRRGPMGQAAAARSPAGAAARLADLAQALTSAGARPTAAQHPAPPPASDPTSHD